MLKNRNFSEIFDKRPPGCYVMIMIEFSLLHVIIRKSYKRCNQTESSSLTLLTSS